MESREDKWEKLAKLAEEYGIQNLADAARSSDVQESCRDITDYDGWIRCITSSPPDNELVMVTDGKEVWMGDYLSKRKPNDRWSLVYNGAPPFDSTEIIAWQYKPSVPPELIESLRLNEK